MLTLTLRTDKPEAELSLYNDQEQLEHITWQAHRELAETLHQKIADLLTGGGNTLQDIQGIAVYQGPGSFTGLRIGISVANALADSLKIPITGTQGQNWRIDGLKRLADGQTDTIVLPEYGAPVHITTPKK